MNRSVSKALPIAVLLMASLLVAWPLLRSGLAPGHDRRVHLEYQHFFNDQISRGELYPRWLSGLNLGRGSPIFFVQYPLPYYLPWLFEQFGPASWAPYAETHAQGLSVALASLLAALFAYAWCSTFASRLSATIAALVFLTLPYFLCIDLYLRIAVGEVWAFVFLPLALYFLECRASAPRRAVAGVALAYGLLVLTHLFTAVLFLPFLVAYALWRPAPAQRLAALLEVAAGLALGCALAGVYLLPFIGQRHFLHPENYVLFRGANYSPISHIFAFDRTMLPDETRAWHLLSWLARALATVAVGLLGYVTLRARVRSAATLARSNALPLVLASLAILVLVLTILAGHLPGLRPLPGSSAVGQDIVDLRAHIFLATFLTLLLGVFCYASLDELPTLNLANLFFASALLSFFMTSRWSLLLWQHIRSLASMQFPWRFNVFLALSTTGLVALTLDRLASRPPRPRVLGLTFLALVWLAASGGFAIAGHLADAFHSTPPVAYKPFRDEALPVYVHISKMQDALEAINAPRSANPDARITSGQGTATIAAIRPRLLELRADCSTPCTVEVGQFFYDAWRAHLADSGAEIPIRPSDSTGLIELSLPAANSHLFVELPRTCSESAGLALTLLALATLLALFILGEHPRPSS